MNNLQLKLYNRLWCNDGPSEKFLYRTCRNLSLLTKNDIMNGVRWPNPGIKAYYLKYIFPNMLSNTSLDFISGIGVTDYTHYDE